MDNRIVSFSIFNFQLSITIMLLIWDIHITSKFKDRILQNLREYILSSEDQDVVFLWDFVYHFNYDRKALMGLFDLFVECFQAKKSLYILAWNHDRIAGHFVYAEAKKAFSFLDKSQGVLTFITEPEFHTIQDQECLFFPYHIPSQETKIRPEFQELAESSHTKEQRSWRANSLVMNLIEDRRVNKKSEKLMIFHHRYLVWTSFPWQFSKFWFKNPWLSNSLFDVEDILLCSGHLHQPFCYKNYLCLGSVWHTSPLEINQTKYLFSYEVKKNEIIATPIYTNPYIRIAGKPWWKLSLEDIEIWIQQLEQESKMHLLEWVFWVSFIENTWPDLKDCTLTIDTDVHYDQIDTIVQEKVFENMRDVRITQSKRQLPQILDLLDTQSKELWARISDRKSLLKTYLDKKYQDDANRYIEQLESMKIL